MPISETLSSATQSAESGACVAVDFNVVSTSFVGTWTLETEIGGDWCVVATATDAEGVGLNIQRAAKGKWRFNVTTYTSGSIAVHLTEQNGWR